MSVNLTKSPAVVLARNSWTRETFLASLTAVPLSFSVPRSTRQGGWTFHVSLATPAALQRPYSPQAAAALTSAKDSSR